jgi:hypothetical protein
MKLPNSRAEELAATLASCREIDASVRRICSFLLVKWKKEDRVIAQPETRNDK